MNSLSGDEKSDVISVFMASPLVQWIQLLVKRETLDVEDLIDGVVLNEIMLQIDPRPKNPVVNKNVRNDANLILQNLTILLCHIKSYYEEVQKQVVVMPLPKLLTLVKGYKTPDGLAELEKLLLLILGCAVQCDHRETFVETMKQLTYEGMEIMMNHIKNITENTDNVLNLQWEDVSEIPQEELKILLQRMSIHVHNLVTERDKYNMNLNDLSLERDYLQSQIGEGSPKQRDGLKSPATKQHLIVELNENKARLRKARQELDEKVEENSDLKQELQESQNKLREIKEQNINLVNDARGARTLRDENDILKDKAAKASRLEFEADMLKEKLKDIDFYRQRVEEIREDNRILHDTKNLLEEQLESTRSRLDDLVDVEKKMIEMKQQIHEMTQDREKDKLQIQELMDLNSTLQYEKMQSMNESGSLAYQLEQAKEKNGSGRLSIFAESEESIHTRALRLEKENKHLQTLVNTYKDSMKSAELTETSLAQLEKENTRLSNKVTQLQDMLNKEKQAGLDFEQLSNELSTERQRLETTLKTSQTSSERRIAELEAENVQLLKTTETLRERAKIGGNAKVKAIEKENKVLSELVKDVTAKLHKSEYEQKQLTEKVLEMKESVEQAEIIEKENVKLEKQNVTLEKNVKKLEIACNNFSTMEQNATDLEVQNRQLKKRVEHLTNLTDQFEALEADKTVTEQEASRLRRQVESLKKSCSKMTELEQDKLEAQKTSHRLQQTIDAMKVNAKKTEKLEIVQEELENELERLRSQLDLTKQRLNSRENDLHQLERNYEKKSSELNHTTHKLKRLEKVDKENQELVEKNSQMKSTGSKQSHEIARLKHQLDEVTSECETAQSELTNLSRQNKNLLSTDVEMQKTVSELSMKERELTKLQKQQAVNKATLNELREELVNEKLNCQQKQAELERLQSDLNSIGLSQEDLVKASSNKDNERFTALESRFESTLKKSLEAKENKISSLESRLQESVHLNNKLRTDLRAIKHDYESLSQRHQEEVMSADPKQRNKDYASSEILKIKDHLISVERKNATLLAENGSLKSSSQDLQSHVKSLKSQITNIQRQQEKTQETNSNLQKQCIKLQVENSTLQSQCSSLMSQNAQSNSTQVASETEKQELVKEFETIKKEKKLLEKDHDDMSVLHERQTVELENLLQDQQKLKQQSRQMRVELKNTEEKLQSMIRRSSHEQHQRETETHSVSENFGALKEAHEKLNNSYKNLNNEYEELQGQYSTLKSSLNQTKLEYAKLEAESSDIKDHNQQLDITAAKLNNRCEVLMQLKANLEEENRHLLEQISRLMGQNEELLSQTLESKDQIYSEQKQYTERMQEIRRQKEKLEEKIMDLYRAPGHSPSKRKGITATIRKTWQSIGKTGESRRKRDGLPTSSSLHTPNHDQRDTNHPEFVSSSSIHSFPNESASVDSGSAEGHLETGTKEPATHKNRRMRRNLSLFNQLQRIYPARRKGSYTLDSGKGESQDKRRTQLGGNLAHSTNALHSLSVSPQVRLHSKSSAASNSIRGSSFTQYDAHGKSTNDLSTLGHEPVAGETRKSEDGDSQVSPSKQVITLQQFLTESDHKPQTPQSGRKQPEVVLRTSSSKPRPKSMHSTPESMSLKSKSDNATVQRLDSLVGSPRAYDVAKNASFSVNKSKKMPVSPRNTPPHSRDMTSTPVSNRGMEDSGLSPIPSSLADHPTNPIRRDVPPPSLATYNPNPIRRDVPPEIQPRQRRSVAGNDRKPRSSSVSPDERANAPLSTSNDDSDKSTQWYEYGCV
uniref:Girdin n=1 Tax=Phallusia mammillata TaxID=59560 RepID=A0A6F9D9G2_9ASCI|nr:girdin [Phallusia mammillata]